LRNRATDYIGAHPDSVPKAFFWNGLSRFWDVRRPARILAEAGPTGRSRTLTAIGIAMHYVLLPLALAGLWIMRRRRGLVLPLVTMALAASLVFTADATSRYRAPFEPVIVILALAGATPLSARARARRARASVPTV
jgi:hypothetical protein